MRKFPCIVAALTSACCVLLLAGALFPIASDLLAGLRDASVSPASAKVIRVENGDRGDNLESSGLPGPPPTVALDSQNVRGILGSAVRSATDEDMGRVVDVIVDRSGDGSRRGHRLRRLPRRRQPQDRHRLERDAVHAGSTMSRSI